MCASCNDLHPWFALLIGIIAGAMLLDWHYFLCYLQIDDPLDAVGGMLLLELLLKHKLS